MRSILSKGYVRRAVFFGMLLLTVMPLISFPFISINNHQIHHTPAIRDGVLDLAGYGFSNRQGVLLDGEWEFYHDRFIISEPGGDVVPDMMVPVPSTWRHYRIDGEALPPTGKASYRLMVRNCPGDQQLLVYIPNISSFYRAYVDGELVSSREDIDGRDTKLEEEGVFRLLLNGAKVPYQSDIEVVIELQSLSIGGLYRTPVLTELEDAYLYRDMRNIIAAAATGAMLVSIGCIVCFMLFRDKLLYSAALVVTDVLVCLRFLSNDEFFEVIRYVVPGFRYYAVSSGLRIATFYLPLIFLFCIKQLFHIPFRNRTIWLMGLYELLLSPVLFWCAFNGWAHLQFFICMAGYLPFVFVGVCLYREVLRGRPYSLLASSSFLFIMGSVMSASLNDSGLLVMSVSLYSPGCFVIALLLQLALFIWRAFEMQLKATEAENLRLRLKDKETSLMLSQIQPHFLYNTLIAIHMMCLEEPEAAARTTLKFATFLRANMRFIRDMNPIPFQQELEHIRNYTDIEEVRFKGRLSMQFEIGTVGFFVPALTIQPLVENAIRHGACKNLDGGSVTLQTFETEAAFCVDVIDDGPGFDTGMLRSPPEDSYGITNIIFRLEEQIRARVRIESSIGRGTQVHIKIPKGGTDDEGNHNR